MDHRNFYCQHFAQGSILRNYRKEIEIFDYQISRELPTGHGYPFSPLLSAPFPSFQIIFSLAVFLEAKLNTFFVDTV